ncbi:hypothetical protein RV11_GL002223 [Enterococcus phoeniculicola]|jgi:hypothetical protein|uniref:DUF3284 domain-containing protein n=1 Tax=Enterococcus phoeniculicola ATCC BAA-412 TaxID=1158610 RepID=R3WMA1_9ENTE|nr:DUF3284 domain-containing protein [Enterococcus phoeniculicola]EOL48956.1 hypothetical protein UC3_00508 [Enterococcus phoeniculicola ATCC BAA-412]EOT72802.1 hypothetical protein I589_03072 [Enterococcus phoeniculicola ATCC BAA-412]OJG69768.1 hypothetical protein RV11_GL002223 [Enterococcus phoeniculicola]
MEIVKKLNIPAEFFFDKVVDSVIFDIRKATGKSVTRKQLRNYEYVKQFSKDSRARIKIEKFVENQSYHFRTSTTRNSYVVQYEVRPIDEKSCEVHYSETMESFGFIQKANDFLLGIALGFFKKRQFKKMLTMIEESY